MITPVWERGDRHNPWDCLACALTLEDPPPRPRGSSLSQPDTRPRLWEPKGPLSPEFDPCGAGPIRAGDAQ